MNKTTLAFSSGHSHMYLEKQVEGKACNITCNDTGMGTIYLYIHVYDVYYMHSIT